MKIINGILEDSMAHGRLPETKHKNKGEKKLPPTRFDLGQMAWNYALAKFTLDFLSQKLVAGEALELQDKRDIQDAENWFSGLIKGYDDWFETLKIDQDKFDEIQQHFSADQIRKEAKKMAERVLKGKKDERPLIEIPGDSPTVTKAVKEIFDETVLGMKGVKK